MKQPEDVMPDLPELDQPVVACKELTDRGVNSFTLRCQGESLTEVQRLHPEVVF